MRPLLHRERAGRTPAPRRRQPPRLPLPHWAGNSVPVLLATYAWCVEGQLPDLKKRLEAAGDLPEPIDAG